MDLANPCMQMKGPFGKEEDVEFVLRQLQGSLQTVERWSDKWGSLYLQLRLSLWFSVEQGIRR